MKEIAYYLTALAIMLFVAVVMFLSYVYFEIKTLDNINYIHYTQE